MPGIFLGVKCQARVFFWVPNMKLLHLSSCLLRVPPLGIAAVFSLNLNGSVIPLTTA